MSSGIRIEFISDGIPQVEAMFEAAAARGMNMSAPLHDSSRLLLKTFDMNFDSNGSMLGEPWQPRQKSYGWPTLQRTGLLRHGFASAFGMDFVTLFNSVYYFKYHQSAAPRKTRLPRRIMMKVDEIRRRQVIKNFQAYVMGQK